MTKLNVKTIQQFANKIPSACSVIDKVELLGNQYRDWNSSIEIEIATSNTVNVLIVMFNPVPSNLDK